MEDKILIADTKDILEAFIDNGLHKEFEIYCQFPHCDKMLSRIHKEEVRSIEFNDGYRLQDK